MSSPDSALANVQQTIDYLECQGQRAERDEALPRETATADCSKSSIRETG